MEVLSSGSSLKANFSAFWHILPFFFASGWYAGQGWNNNLIDHGWCQASPPPLHLTAFVVIKRCNKRERVYRGSNLEILAQAWKRHISGSLDKLRMWTHEWQHKREASLAFRRQPRSVPLGHCIKNHSTFYSIVYEATTILAYAAELEGHWFVHDL